MLLLNLWGSNHFLLWPALITLSIVRPQCLFLLLLLLSLFSHVALCVTPQMAAHPPSLGFSRQEHWSGLPFLSPMHGSEKWKWSRSVVSDPQRPHGLQPCRLLHPWDFPGKSTGVGCHCLLRVLAPNGVLLQSVQNRVTLAGLGGLILRNACSQCLPFVGYLGTGIYKWPDQSRASLVA